MFNPNTDLPKPHRIRNENDRFMQELRMRKLTKRSRPFAALRKLVARQGAKPTPQPNKRQTQTLTPVREQA